MAYFVYNINETVRVPPSEMGANMKKKILKVAREEYEGMLDEDLGLILAVVGIDEVADGKVVPGDGAIHYPSNLNMLVYKPEVQEVVEGQVTQIAEFGIFVRIGPMDGLVHVSQIMDEYINYDSKLPSFSGKETNKKVTLNDSVLARIVTVSLKGSTANSKIGLTMRQLGLGKLDWKKIDEKEKEKKKDFAVKKRGGEKEEKEARRQAKEKSKAEK